jgi:isopropylmalate/homocitrate/citramalate synthase
MEVTANDGSRADLPYLLKYYRAVVEAGAVATRLNESVPAMSPLAIKYMVTKVKEVLPIPLGVHCHNSWGLALANACAAVEAGAEVVDASINGLAGHAGNVSLDEAAMTFQYLYGFDMRIRPEGFAKAARLIEEISGQWIASSKPIVGRNVYAHSGHHSGTKNVRNHPQSMEPFPPEMVGNIRRWPLQWDTSDTIIRFRLDDLGIDDTAVDVGSVREAVVQFAREHRREMEPEEFEKLVAKKRQ